MNKKLIAVAVAGVFAAPATFAQSSVTISGAIIMSIEQLRINNAAAARTTKSEGRLNDESSSIIFTVREDLGGGMTALARVDVKPNPDSSAIAASGESYIGLSTANAGRFTAGRHNFHFFKTPYDGYGLSTPLKVHPSSIIDFAGGGTVAIANATRTPNSLMWSSPRWGGFTVDAGYSFNPFVPAGSTTTALAGSTAVEADMTAGNTLRKGRAWMLNPTYTGANWAVAYSYWSSKGDAATAALAASDQRSDSLYGYYTWGGFKLGLMWNKSKLTTASGPTSGAKVGDRTAWSIPLRYTWGQHNILAHYTKARNDKATAAQDGAKMLSLSYAYTLSKRTSVSLNYARISNDVGAAYDLYTSNGGLGSANAVATAGEDPRTLSFGIRHNF